MLAGRFTLLEQGALAELLPARAANGLSILRAGPLNSGLLATGAVPNATYDYQPAPAPVMERVRRLETTCRARGVDLATAAPQFPLAHPSIVSIVAGSIHPDEMRENAARLAASIPARSWADLKAHGLIDAAAPVPS